jgi:hypothetical protein
MLMPAAMASAGIVIPGHAATTIPAASQPSPASAVITGDGELRAEARSASPVTMSAPAASTISTDSEVNGRVTRKMPKTTHASPRTSDTQRGRRRKGDADDRSVPAALIGSFSGASRPG